MRKIYIVLLVMLLAVMYFIAMSGTRLPAVAIASYGPHSSLSESIEGLKEELESRGYIK